MQSTGHTPQRTEQYPTDVWSLCSVSTNPKMVIYGPAYSDTKLTPTVGLPNTDMSIFPEAY
jgi:hypothetical protein